MIRSVIVLLLCMAASAACAASYNTRSVAFDGVTEYIDCGTNSTLFFGTNDVSYSFWVKPRVNHVGGVFSKLEQTAPWSGVRGYTAGALQYMQFDIYSTSVNYLRFRTPVGSTPAGSWTHVVVCLGTDTNNLRIYVNGVSQFVPIINDNLSAFPGDDGDNFTIGMLDEGNANPFDGKVDEFAVWDKRLSSNEAIEVWNDGLAYDLTTHSAASNIVSYWRLGDSPDAGTNFYDVVGSNDGIAPVQPTITNDAAPSVQTEFEGVLFSPFNGLVMALNDGRPVILQGVKRPLPPLENTYATEFDGTTEWLRTDTTDFNVTNDLSVNAWIKTTDAEGHLIAKFKAVGSSVYSWRMYLNTGKLRVQVRSSAAGPLKSQISTVAVNDGSYHNVGFTFSTNDLRLYIDGARATVTTNTDDVVNSIQSSTTIPVFFGVRGNLSGYYAGIIEEPTLWSGTVLDAGDFAELWGTGEPNYPTYVDTDATLEHWWRMGDSPDVSTNFVDRADSDNLEPGVEPDIVADVP